MTPAMFDNWGETRLGVLVHLTQLELPGYEVLVGPFFELLGMMKEEEAEAG